MTDRFEPLQPRPADLPRPVPLHDDADLTGLDDAKIIAAPSSPSLWPRWRDQLHRWRAEAQARTGGSDELYRREELRWTRSCFVVAQIWLWDELLYDHDRDVFTPQRLLADAERFGGFDGIVLWHAYPVIGIDERNQWDYYRLVPGLDELIEELHDAGVRVFVDYNPWDTGTRRCGTDAEELAGVVAELDADGVFLDTLKEGGPELLSRLDEARSGVAVEGESTLPLARLVDHPLSWAQWFADTDVPGVIRAHWYEQRHLLHHVRRWHRDHHLELQSAWFNGVGVMVWEVVFGVWVGWSERDAAMLRAMAPVQRALAPLLSGGDWTPLVDLGPQAAADGVYGSSFGSDDQQFLALVNRSAHPVTVRVPFLGTDVFTGRRLDDQEIVVPPDGIAGVYAGPVPLSPAEPVIDHRIGFGDAAFPYRETRRIPPPAVPVVSPPDVDRVVVPAGRHRLTVRYRNRETGLYGEAPFVDEWKPLSPRLHDLRTRERIVDLHAAVAVARREVTRAEYARYLAELDRPCAFEKDDQPMSGVDLAEARAYAAWAGARLPTEDEWQLAAADPTFCRARPMVWNLTESEHTDGRSRFMIIKGGSEFGAVGSDWYIDSGPQPPEVSCTYLIPGRGLSRSVAIGFRLAWPVEDDTDRVDHERTPPEQVDHER